ncbi:MAG: S41 family peptidase [Phycisphaerales bacterium]
MYTPAKFIHRVAAISLAMIAGTATASDHAGLIQYPTLSPDGNTVVFSAAGDLWAINSAGGAATRITAHPAIESRAKFNSDGTQIAFESNRGGSANIFVADVQGAGQQTVLSGIERVTTSDRSQWLGGFSDDDRSVVFSAYLFPEIYRQPRMYEAPLDGGPLTDLTGAFGRAPAPSVDGDDYFFIRGYFYPHRSIYKGSGNLDIWKYSTLEKDFEQVTGFDGNDMDPCPLPDGSLLYLSSKDGQYNVYRLDAGKTDRKGRNSGKQLTSFAPTASEHTIAHGVRDLSVSRDGSTAVFVVMNTLYTLDLNTRNAQPVAVKMVMGTDSDRDLVKRMNLSRRVSQGAMHPTNEAVAVVARNELFVRSTSDDHPTRRITNTSVREQDLAWSPTGEVLYFTSDDEKSLGSIFEVRVTLSSEDLEPEEVVESDTVEEETNPENKVSQEAVGEESGGTEDANAEPESDDSDTEVEKEDPVDFGARWAGALRFEITPLIQGPEHVYAPTPSPDGKHLLYKRERGDVVLLNLETKEERVILESWADPNVQWTSDSVHVVYSGTDLNFNTDIFILDTRLDEEGNVKDPVNITRHPDIDHSPQLSADGKVLTFLSDRGSNNWEWDVYAINLDRDLDGMPRYELDEYYAEAVKAVKGRKPLVIETESESKDKDSDFDSGSDSDSGSVSDESDSKSSDEAGDEPDVLEFDLADAYLRVRRLTNTPESESNLIMSPAANRIAFTVGGAFVSIDQYAQERKTLHSGGISSPQMSLDGSTVNFVSGGQSHSVAIGGGKVKTYSIDADIDVDMMGELNQKFSEASGRFGLNFYHPTLKGLDWDAVSDRYRGLALQTRTNAAFQRVVTLLFGEVDGSHTGIRGGDGFSAGSTNNGYLGVDTTPVARGHRIDRVYAYGATDRMDDGMQVGDVIIAIGDQVLVSDSVRDLHTAMNNMSGKEVLVEYLRNNEESGEWDTHFGMVTPASFGANTTVRYRQEVMDRQAEVDKLSDGKLGYLHIRSMGEPSVRDFERDLFAAAEGKEGLVIDVRDNGGGWTTDILLASLTAPTHAYTIPRGANPDDVRPDSYPRDRRLIYAYSRPIVVLINENSFSNAEIFAHSIRTAKRGRIVGVPTFGGVISTGSFSLIDGTSIRRPFRGWYLPDGTDMENNGAKPDVFVEQTPADEAAGRDPQLEAGVKDLLKTIR